MQVEIVPFEERFAEQVTALSVRAWQPVFEHLQQHVQQYVYHAFYPLGWEQRQVAEIEAFLRDEGDKVWLAVAAGIVLGWIGIRIHPEDQMGEVYILAVDPAQQRKGVAAALMRHGFATMQANGLVMAMVETGDDPGHAASRAAYEAAGFTRWPVARYFRKL